MHNNGPVGILNSRAFVSLAERTFALPVTQLWETSHVWSSIESERGSLFQPLTAFYTVAKFLGKGISMPSLIYVFPRSFKQLIGGLGDVNNKQCDSDEVKAK